MAKKPAAKAKTSGGKGNGAWKPAAGEVGIRVRMYRVGFGDFFLVTLLDDAGKSHHIVIDCGVFKGTSQEGDIGSIVAAVADMASVTGGDIDLIVMTHRHADHIAGFARCRDTFKAMKVGAVWMPIWESEYEPAALKFQEDLAATALALRSHFATLAARSDGQETAFKYMQNATGEFGAAAAAAGGSNATALKLLKHELGVAAEYYQAGDEAKLPKALSQAGLEVEVLGPPPIKDLDLMKLMDLQKNVGQYLSAAGAAAAAEFRPFGREWEQDPDTPPSEQDRECYTPQSFREWVQDPRKSWQKVTPEEAVRARQRMEQTLQASEPIAALMAAKQLNAFLNNQSLVLLFTFRGRKLLFVGDAQAGNWEHWLFETDTPDKKGSGQASKKAQQILASIDFYKVGHHGSGNATPKVAATVMGTAGHRFACMCSTQADVYGTEDPDNPSKGTEVPRIPLLKQLGAESAFVRSDQIDIKVDGKKVPAKAKHPLPAAAQGKRFEAGDLWIDCFL